MSLSVDKQIVKCKHCFTILYFFANYSDIKNIKVLYMNVLAIKTCDIVDIKSKLCFLLPLCVNGKGFLKYTLFEKMSHALLQ